MFILSEIEYNSQVENAPTFTNCDEYETREEAQARLHKLYRTNAIENNSDIVYRAEFNENSAMVEFDNGMTLEWEIEEVGI